MEKIIEKYLTGERALFQKENAEIIYSTFADGESPLKESKNITIRNTSFKWKYPLWYSNNIEAYDTTLFETARSGIWYTNNIKMINSLIEAPKTFRRSSKIELENISMPNALETFWNCSDIKLNNVVAKGDYFALNSQNIKATNLTLYGNYSFDGGKNIEIHNSKLLSKDAFWNAENVTVYNSYISGEYLGWNSKNITFINCTIESLQGMCYMENVVLKNCKLINTTLAFEYSTVSAEINGSVDSILNPISGKISADNIKELILESDKIDPTKTIITTEVKNIAN